MQRGTHDELFADQPGRVCAPGIASGLARPAIRAFFPDATVGVLGLRNRLMPFRGDANDAIAELGASSTLDIAGGHFATRNRTPARFIVEELLPYSRPEQTAANLPLALDDPEAVWWVSSGSVDVFFISSSRRDQPVAGVIFAGSRKGDRSSPSAEYAADGRRLAGRRCRDRPNS